MKNKITLFIQRSFNAVGLFAILFAAVLNSSQAQNTWTQKADFGGGALVGGTAFSIGSKGYVSGDHFWEYDPATNTWTQKADFEGSGGVGFSIGSKGYIVFSNYFAEYDPITNTWTQKADFAGNGADVGFSIGSKGYIGGNYTKDFWEYDPESNTWARKADFGGSERWGAVGFSIGNRGYIGTGYFFILPWQDVNYRDFWQYNPDSNIWTQKADFGGSGRNEAVAYSIGGKGYIGAGMSWDDAETDYYQDFWEYDPTTNSWTQKADFGGPARQQAFGFSVGNKGYVGTGYYNDWQYGGSYYYNDFWEYTPGCNDLTVYADADGDGYGDISNSYLALDCVVPNGYVSDSTDCNDNNAGILGTATYYFDGDGDGYGDPNAYVIECSQPLGYVTNNAECNDNTASINPGAAELLNGIDDNCNGNIDEGFCDMPLGTSATNITATSARLKWDAVTGAEGYKIRYKVSGTGAWILKYTTGKSQILNNLSSNTNYTWEIKTYCTIAPGSSSDWSAKQKFTTGSLRMGDELVQQISFLVYPNPTDRKFTLALHLNSEESIGVLEVIDMIGRIVYEEKIAVTNGEFKEEIQFAGGPDGIYMVKVVINDEVYTKQLVLSNQ